jgi:hypothetical protein
MDRPMYHPLRTQDEITQPLPPRFRAYTDWNGMLTDERYGHSFTYQDVRAPIIAGYVLTVLALGGLGYLVWWCVRA